VLVSSQTRWKQQQQQILRFPETKTLANSNSGSSLSLGFDFISWFLGTISLISSTILCNRCEHYKRRCKIRAPCCNLIFSCRHCHNDSAVRSLLLIRAPLACSLSLCLSKTTLLLSSCFRILFLILKNVMIWSAKTSNRFA